MARLVAAEDARWISNTPRVCSNCGKGAASYVIFDGPDDQLEHSHTEDPAVICPSCLRAALALLPDSGEPNVTHVTDVNAYLRDMGIIKP